MNIRWKKLLIQGAIWLVSELILNLAGLDNLADYSEIVFEQHPAIIFSQFRVCQV
ncbi:MAG: hypothetical protein ACRC8A_20020 [Microcoleaceae cyanobacterium]